MSLVVTDTGPLLHLQECGALDLLVILSDVFVTPTVWSEFRHHAPSFPAGELPSWLKLSEPSATALGKAEQWVQGKVLHAGEAEALAFALEIRADIFLTDDMAARTLGESLGLQVRGSLGVVLYAAAAGHLEKDRCLEVFSDLETQSTLWMSARVRGSFRNALEQIYSNRSKDSSS